jgi:hypothetical protein
MTNAQTNQTNNQTYNGWPNRPTWLVSLWLNNDQDAYNHMHSILNTNDTTEFKAQTIKEFIHDCINDMEFDNAQFTDGLISDLINDSLDDVYWYEIVKSNEN